MKRILSTEFAVGAFALLGLLIIIYMSLKVNDRGYVGTGSKIYQAHFESVSGLIRKVPIEVAGITVGYVEDMRLDGDTALVHIRVRKDIQVHADAALTIRDRGLLGDKFIMMNPGTSETPVLADGGEIRKTYTKNDFQQIAQSLTETANTVRELVESDNPKGALGRVVVNMRDMSQKLNDIVGANENRVSQILRHLESFSADLSDITGENKEQIHSVLVALGDVAVSMRDALGKNGQISMAAEHMNKSMESLDRILAKVERGEGTVGKLLNDETTVNKVNETLDNVNDTMGLFRKIQLGIRYRGEYLTSSKQLQNLVGITLAPAPDKYLLFEIVSAPRGRTHVTDTTVTSGGATVSTTQVVQTDNNLLFTLLLAKRFWDLTLRFGLIRNQGGVGADYSLFHDKLVLSVEAFDFNRPSNRMQLRGYGTIVLYKHLLLTGGVDDIVTKIGGRNAFVGGGIQFTDDDLKALVMLAPRSGL
ncbi:MAG: MlaD family protein [Pseudomonadota bacterium]